ncbi:MAG: hypothetical protein IJ689_07120 [Alphaproteobacteria bacterium]|nr:hypothetical protein [Alphaproteobacteria bacterium]
MKNYILMLGAAGVALSSYCAYAANSATMTVTATIAHDVSLGNVTNINLGTITINPAATEETYWHYDDMGNYSFNHGDAVVSVGNATVGSFTANIPNPSACDTASYSCGGLSILELESGRYLNGVLSGNDYKTWCSLMIKHRDGNTFTVYPDECQIEAGEISFVTAGSKSKSFTINYTPS